MVWIQIDMTHSELYSRIESENLPEKRIFLSIWVALVKLCIIITLDVDSAHVKDFLKIDLHKISFPFVNHLVNLYSCTPVAANLIKLGFALYLRFWITFHRPEFPSHSLMKPIEILSYHLELLSKVVDSVVFKEAWKCVAEVLNRLIYNKLVMETQFSLQVSQSCLLIANCPCQILNLVL